MKQSEVKEVANELIGWDGNKVFRTFKYLSTRPGQLISEYCNGEKEKYLSPVTYFFGVSAIMFYFQSISGLEEMVKNANQWKQIFSSLGIDLSTSKIDNVTSIIFNPTFLNILYIPLTLVATWLVFRKHNQSFRDNSWFTLYIAAQSSLFLLPALLTFWLYKDIFPYTNIVFSLLILVYTIWASKQFYKITVVRAILLNLLKIVLVLPFTYLLLGAVILMIYYFS